VVVNLSRRPPCAEQLVIHTRVNSSLPRPALCCAAHTVWPQNPLWGCTDPLAWGKLSQLLGTEEPAGSFRLVPVITTALWSCLYLTEQKEVIIRTSPLLNSRN